MRYHATIRNESFTFVDLRELLAKANEEKSGDSLAGLAASSARERVAAKWALADVTLGEIVANPVIDPDEDDVSRLIVETQDRAAFDELRSRTVGEFREYLLSERASEATLRRLRWAITPEIAAAVAKLMSNQDLVVVAAKIRNVTRCRNTIGERGVLAIRVQPNHPSDDLRGIVLSALDGLLFGCGDAVIGVNPAAESVESVVAIEHTLQRLMEVLGVPTQSCCLAHISTQLAALDRGAPIDLLFQSIAGTQTANESFGVSLSLLREGGERVLEHHARRGLVTTNDSQTDRDPHLSPLPKGEGDMQPRSSSHNVMYFETGQGSALSAEAHHGVDQLTLEARAYGVARVFEPFLVNSVVGFIGPEYLANERQIIRAGLEDHFMGKLLGLPMGCDVCYTNHADADQNSADNLLMLLTAAGCNYFMGVPCSDDVMLNYQSTSYHDAAAMRRLFGLRPAPEFNKWLQATGVFDGSQLAVAVDESRRQLIGKLDRVFS